MTLIGVLYHIFEENLSKADNFQTDDEALLMILGKLLYRFNWRTAIQIDYLWTVIPFIEIYQSSEDLKRQVHTLSKNLPKNRKWFINKITYYL